MTCQSSIVHVLLYLLVQLNFDYFPWLNSFVYCLDFTNHVWTAKRDAGFLFTCFANNSKTSSNHGARRDGRVVRNVQAQFPPLFPIFCPDSCIDFTRKHST